MKETKELYSLLGSAVNAGYASMEDRKIDFADLGKVFDPLMKGQDGVQGVGDFPAELAAADVAAKQDGVASFGRELKSLPADDAYDITQMISGLQSTVSLVVRKTRKDTADRIAAALANGPQAASGKAITGDDLLALIGD